MRGRSGSPASVTWIRQISWSTRPGPLLGPEGYRDAGRRFGLELDPARYAEAKPVFPVPKWKG